MPSIGAPYQHRNPFRLNRNDLSECFKQMEEARKRGREAAEHMASFRLPTIDYGKIERMRSDFEVGLRRGEELRKRFADGFAVSTKRYEALVKQSLSLLESGALERTLKTAQETVGHLSDAFLQTPFHLDSITDTIQDRILVKDLILPAEEVSWENEDLPLPMEEIVLQDMELDPETFELPTWSVASPPRRAEREELPFPPQASSATAPSAPTIFLQRVRLSETAKIFKILPEEADLIDETIALYEPHKSGLLLLTQTGFWIKEEDGVTPQSILLIQYLRRIAQRPSYPCASVTELATHLAPRRLSIATGRRSINNRIHRIQEICTSYNCKPIIIKSGGLWRINPELSFWNNISFMPQGHKQGH